MTDALFEVPREQLPNWIKVVLQETTMETPVRREFLVDPTLPAVQVIDLFSVSLGKAPSLTAVLSIRRDDGPPVFAGRGAHHFHNDMLWDVTELPISEVLGREGTPVFEASLEYGWTFTVEVGHPTKKEIAQAKGPFTLLDMQNFFYDFTTPDLVEACWAAESGLPIPPHMEMELFREGLGERILTSYGTLPEQCIVSYFFLHHRDLVFPWMGLLETYAHQSLRAEAAVELLFFLLEEGPAQTLGNGRLTLAERRRLAKFSELFQEAVVASLPSGDLRNMKASTPFPILDEALETLRETSLVESGKKTLAVTDSCQHSYETDESTAYTTTILECFAADVAAGRLVEEPGTAYPMPERIVRPKAGVPYTVETVREDLEFDSYRDDPVMGKLFERVATQLEKAIGADFSGQEDEFPEENDAEQTVSNIIEILDHLDSPSSPDGPEGPDGSDHDGDLQLPQLPDLSIYRGGVADGPFRPQQVDSSVLPGEQVPHVDFAALGPAAEVEHVELEIALDGIKPRISRVLELPRALNMDQAMKLMLVLFGWELTHLYDLSVAKPGTRGGRDRYTIYPRGEFIEPYGEYLWAQDVQLGQVLTPGGATATLTYDYGDGWSMKVKARKYVTRAPGAYLVRASQACPPEDVGGPFGYELARYVVGKGAAQAAKKDPDLDLEWAEEIEEHWRGYDFAAPAYEPGRYPLELGSDWL